MSYKCLVNVYLNLVFEKVSSGYFQVSTAKLKVSRV